MNSSPIPITRRRVNIDFESTITRHWYPEEQLTETFLNAISHFFPPGETFFIESVQHYQARIVDPVLAEQVRDFIYQEAMHTRVHKDCNATLDRHYSYGKKIERIGEVMLNFAKRLTPKSFQLGVTCAIEHYTAILSDTLLARQVSFSQRVEPAFAQLWLWHAVEETEHKAVCFDVFQHVVGSGSFAYVIRVTAMLVTSLFFAIAVLMGMVIIKQQPNQVTAPMNQPGQDRPALNSSVRPKRNWFALLRQLKHLLPWRQYLTYFRPSFHPWDHDNRHLILQWKELNPNFGVSTDAEFSYQKKVCTDERQK